MPTTREQDDFICEVAKAFARGYRMSPEGIIDAFRRVDPVDLTNEEDGGAIPLLADDDVVIME